MWQVRYRTHGPWQYEYHDQKERAIDATRWLAMSYWDVVLEEHNELLRYRKGYVVGPSGE